MAHPLLSILVASSLEHTHNHTSFQDAVISEHERSAVPHASVDADAGWEKTPIPPYCERVRGTSGDAGGPFFVRFFYAGNGILLSVKAAGQELIDRVQNFRLARYISGYESVDGG